MRAPFQILAIPYRYEDGELRVCVLRRSDLDQWQFVAGGGEGNETPREAAFREVSEECHVHAAEMLSLASTCSIPTNIFSARILAEWPTDLYVIPEYSFAFLCPDEIILSHEHTECVWMSPDEARERLKWDSNRTALYELECRLKGIRLPS
jgi:dATP pyrophosphohydrolase